MTDAGAASGQPVSGGLVLADGSMFEGEMFGAPLGVDGSPGAVARGEVVFNTALSGYQEVITDPSYAGQIITFTYPHIGNYGVNAQDAESRGTFARGIVVRDLVRRHSNHRAEEHLDSYLKRHGLAGIGSLDTRRLTRILRNDGAVPGAFGPLEGPGALDEATLKQAAIDEPGTSGVDLVAEVSTHESYSIEPRGDGTRLIVAYDFGIKSTILHHLSALGRVEVVPHTTPAAEVLGRNPSGVFLSNGPGDPEMVPSGIAAVRELLDQVPIFGICLGHQILSLAVGGDVEKLPFGHHGANHPVRELATGKVAVTSQNHNFAVIGESVDDVADVTHVNLNDGVCEGMALRDAPAFSVQHHPEASPGPHDSLYLFDRFADLMDGKAGKDSD